MAPSLPNLKGRYVGTGWEPSVDVPVAGGQGRLSLAQRGLALCPVLGLWEGCQELRLTHPGGGPASAAHAAKAKPKGWSLVSAGPISHPAQGRHLERVFTLSCSPSSRTGWTEGLKEGALELDGPALKGSGQISASP